MKRFLTGKIRVIVMLLLLVVASFGRVETVLAANADVETFVKENAPIYNTEGAEVRPATDKWVSSISEYFSAVSEADKGRTTPITAVYDGSSTHYFYSVADEANILVAISNLKESDMVSKQIEDITAGLNMEADTQGATKIVGGFTPIVNLLLGIAILAIIMLMALYTGSDVMWLAFPVFRNNCMQQVSEGKTGFNVKKDKSSGECRYRFVSDDAVRAYNQSTMDGGNKQPYIKYALSRSWAYVLMGVLVTVLLTGNVEIFLEIGVKIGSGFIEMLKNI